MKKVLMSAVVMFIFSLSIIVFQLSCNKSSVAQRPTDCLGNQSKFEFKVNGVLFKCDAVLNNQLGWVGFPYFSKHPSINGFSLYATNHNDFDPGNNIGRINVFDETQYTCYFHIEFSNTQINTTGSYSSTLAHIELYNNGTSYNGGEARPQSFNFTISSIQNGLVSGTFSGWVDPNSPSNPRLNVTDGIFTNVPIFNR